MDVKRNSYCIDVNKIEEKISKKTKGILAPDLLGNICEWDKIREISYDEKEFISQKLVDHLKIKFNKDLNSDSTFINYMSYVSKIKKNRNKLSVTLNYNKRIQEKKNDSLKNNLLDTSVKITEIFPIEEKNLMDKIKNDLYLRESLKLFAEMLAFKES